MPGFVVEGEVAELELLRLLCRVSSVREGGVKEAWEEESLYELLRVLC